MEAVLNFNKCISIKVILLLVALSSGCGSGEKTERPVTAKNQLDQPEPGEIPRIFAPGLISTSLNERDAAISPDGDEFYFTLSSGFYNTIVFSRIKDGQYGLPEVVSFSGQYSDLEPAFSPDGKRLYFISNRPLDGSEETKDYDIWYVEKKDVGWGEPRNLGAPINSEKDEYFPSITKDGTIYFTAQYESSEDIYRSRVVDGRYLPPERLSDSVNSGNYEFNAFIAPDESYLIFTSYGRDDDLGRGDLYISFRSDDDIWTGAVHMGDKVNSSAMDYCPFVSPDGRHLFFTSRRSGISPYSQVPRTYDQIAKSMNGIENGQGNIYRVSSRVIKVLKK